MSRADSTQPDAGASSSPAWAWSARSATTLESSWRALVAGESGAGEITFFDTTDYPVHFACELKDFDPTRLDRPQGVAADGPVRAARARGRAPGRGRTRASTSRADPERVGASIATGIGGLQLVPGLLRHAARPRARPGQPVRDPDDHPEHGRGLGVDRARHEGAADEPDHGVRRVEHGDRRRARRDPARPRRHDVRRRRRGAGHARWRSPASTRCARSRAGTTTRRARRGRSTRVATGS